MKTEKKLLKLGNPAAIRRAWMNKLMNEYLDEQVQASKRWMRATVVLTIAIVAYVLSISELL